MRHKLVRAVRLMAFVTTAIEETVGFVWLKVRATGMLVEIGWERKMATGRLVRKKMTALLAAGNEDLDVQTHNEKDTRVRCDTRLTICVTVWSRGSSGAKSQRLRRLRCRTQPELCPLPERTGKLAPLTPFFSITVPVVQFFGQSSCLLFHLWLGNLRLTLPLSWSVEFGSDRTHGSPART